jgi:hypothetical protein
LSWNEIMVATKVELALIDGYVGSMAEPVTIQPKSFACPHCGKPIEVDSVLDALSSSDLARAMRAKRKNNLTPEEASEMGKKSAAKRWSKKEHRK